MDDLIVSLTLAHPDKTAIVFQRPFAAAQVRLLHLSKSNSIDALNGSSTKLKLWKIT